MDEKCTHNEPMRAAPDPQTLYETMLAAEEAGVKLEIVGDLQVWEVLPSPRHTLETRRIERSVRPKEGTTEEACGCYALQDMYVRFPDGSLRRPDIAIYCRLPEPTLEAATLLPEAVIEVVSPGSETKDLRLSPPFYLSHGVRDVVVYDPATGKVLHARAAGERTIASPTVVELECGCVVTV